MYQRAAIVVTIVLTVVSAGCRRETPDPDMAAATATTATDTSGTMTATTTASTGGSVSVMSPADKEFVIQAANSSMAEIAISGPVAQRAENPEVRSFAQRMVTDHTKSNQELQQVATTHGIGLPTALEREHQETLESLQSLGGAELDRTYMEAMVENHQKAVSLFENAERSVQHPDLRAWVARTLPVLRDHLQHARTLQSGVQ